VLVSAMGTGALSSLTTALTGVVGSLRWLSPFTWRTVDPSRGSRKGTPESDSDRLARFRPDWYSLGRGIALLAVEMILTSTKSSGRNLRLLGQLVRSSRAVRRAEVQLAARSPERFGVAVAPSLCRCCRCVEALAAPARVPPSECGGRVPKGD
jgi:hypothetical protein